MRVIIRKLMLLGLSLALIFAVVLIYRLFTSDRGPVSSTVENLEPSRSADLDSIKRIPQSERSFQSGDKLEIFFMGPGGRIERAYHAKRFKLVSEDRAALEEVKLVWHLKGGETLTLTSASGDVHIDNGSGGMQPTRGMLSGNVRIVHDTRPEAKPTRRTIGQRDAGKLIITTDKLDFDIPSCRLATAEPVELHGSNLDAYGTGLLLHWREISNDIDSLIIRQGGEMIWYPGPGSGFVSITPEPQEQKPQQTVLPLTTEFSQEQKPQTTVPLVVESSQEQAASAKINSYLATFQRNVRVTHKDQVVENVDTLNVVFDLDTSDDSDSADAAPAETLGPGPSPAPTSEPVQVSAAELEASEPVRGTDEPKIQAPVRITWTGELNIIPKENEDYPPSAPRRFEVEALGAPVELSSGEMFGECARLTAQHQLGTVQLFSSPDFGVELNAADGSTITADEMDIDSTTSTAVMIGKGAIKTTAEKGAVEADTLAQETKGMDLSWNGQATLKFLKDDQPMALASGSDYYLSEATAIDDVVAISDKFRAQANHMYVKLGPPGSDGTQSGQDILLLTAKDDFFSVLGEDGLSVKADAMETHFTRRSSGKGQFPSSIELKGNVGTIQQQPNSDTQSTLESEEMLVSLAENDEATSSGPDGQVGSRVTNLLAKGNVVARQLFDGQVRSSLRAEKLDRDEASKTTLLYGSPAKLIRGEDSIEANIIRIVEQDEHYVLRTPVPGKMNASFASAEKNSVPAKLELNWPGAMVFDGQANKAIFTLVPGQLVKGQIDHSPKRVSALEAEQLELFLQDEEHSSPAGSAEQMSSGSVFEPMGSKSLEKMILTGKAMVRSVEQSPDASNKRLRAVRLSSDVLTYLAEEGQFQGQGPGTLLLEDNRPTDKEVSAKKPTAQVPKSRGSLRFHRVGLGQTAFEWTDSVDYDQAKRRAVLLGDVHMISRGYALTMPAKPSERAGASNRRDLTELWCQEFTLIHAESKTDGTSGGKSGMADLSGMDELEIESIRALGSKSSKAVLSSSDVHIEGQKIFHNAKSNEIIITGTRKQKAILEYSDPVKGWGRWTGNTVYYNTVTHTGSAPGGRFNTVR